MQPFDAIAPGLPAADPSLPCDACGKPRRTQRASNASRTVFVYCPDCDTPPDAAGVPGVPGVSPAATLGGGDETAKSADVDRWGYDALSK